MKVYIQVIMALFVCSCKKNQESSEAANEVVSVKPVTIEHLMAEEIKSIPQFSYSYKQVKLSPEHKIQIQIPISAQHLRLQGTDMLDISPYKRQKFHNLVWKMNKLDEIEFLDRDEIEITEYKAKLKKEWTYLTKKNVFMSSPEEINEFTHRVSQEPIFLDRYDLNTIRTIIKKTIYHKQKEIKVSPLDILSAEERQYLEYYRILADTYPNEKLDVLLKGLSHKYKIYSQ